MPSEGIPIADAIQSGAGLISTAVGLINAGATKREAQRLAKERPQYQISPLAGQDLSLAQSDLANGMSSAAEKAYTDLDNSQYSSSVGAILKGGGDVNSIGGIYGNNQEGRLRLAQMKDQLRLQQISDYVRANQAMQQEQQTQWQVDKFAPWQDKAQANAEARKSAQLQINNGLNAFAGGAMNAAQSMQEQNSFTLPTGATGSNGSGYNNGYATGVPISYTPSAYPSAGNLTPMSTPSYNGWRGTPYNLNG